MYTLVLLNGGIGRRMSALEPKQFLKVHGIPILVYSLVAADSVPEITEIALNYPEGWLDQVQAVVQDYAIKTPVTYVPAGDTRQGSVTKSLDFCTNEHVLLHETARPVISASDFATLIATPQPNVSFMARIPFTVAPVDPSNRRVIGYLDRESLRNVQLPQKFRLKDLRAAHQFASHRPTQYTEDATMMAEAGLDVHYIDGRDNNIKVTTSTDLHLVTSLLTRQPDDD